MRTKSIFPRRKRLTLLGLLGTIGVIAGHYLITTIYVVFWDLVNRYLIGDHFFFFNINYYNWIIFFVVFVSPGLNAIFHIFYRDSGIIIWRMLLWLSMTVIIIITPFFILL